MAEQQNNKLTFKESFSSDQLDEYIRVYNPNIRLMFFSMMIIVAAILIWGYSETIPSCTKLQGAVIGHNTAVCFISADEKGTIAAGMTASVVLADNKETFSLLEVIHNTFSKTDPHALQKTFMGTVTDIGSQPIDKKNLRKSLNLGNVQFDSVVPSGDALQIEITFKNENVKLLADTCSVSIFNSEIKPIDIMFK